MFELRQYSLLFLTATIWGSGFIGQKLGVEYIPSFAFTFYRTLIGGLFLIPVILFLKHQAIKHNKKSRTSSMRMFILGSLSCGFCLILGESLQQFGLVHTDVNKASFITSLYMIFVPVIGFVLGHKTSIKILFCLLLSCIGLFLFCVKDGLALQRGDFLVLLCAIAFAYHILVIAYFINHVDGVLLSCGQFFCASAMGLIMMLLTEVPSVENLKAALPALLYVGIMSNGVAYTLQIVAQRGINSTIASLIMSLESVMGAFFGVICLDEIMSNREMLGALLMFTAVILTQVKLTFFRKSKKSADLTENR